MTCIAVIGPHRSGTSAVAGVLYHLGIPMGDDLIGPGLGNPTGHFEDAEFVDLHDEIIGDWKNPQVDFDPYRETYTALVSKREKQHLWGIKDPRMCFVFPYFIEIARDVLIVSVHRDPMLCANSLFARGGHTREEAMEISTNYLVQQLEVLTGHSHFRIDYQYMINYPEETVTALANWVGLSPTENAIDFVDPSLCHHGR